MGFHHVKCPAFIRTHSVWIRPRNESLFAFDTFALDLIPICFRYADTYIGLFFFPVIT